MATNGYCNRCKTYCYGDCRAGGGYNARPFGGYQKARRPAAQSVAYTDDPVIMFRKSPHRRSELVASLASARDRLTRITDPKVRAGYEQDIVDITAALNA